MKGNIQIIVKIVFTVVILSIAGLLARNFSSQLKINLEKQEYEVLSEIAEYNNQTLVAKLEQQIKILEMTAKACIYYNDKPQEELCAFLKTVSEAGSFDRLSVTDINGNAIFSDGSVGNIAHRYYFKKSISGQKCIEAPLASIVSGNPIMVLSTPIYMEDSIIGIVHGTYELKTAGNVLLKSSEEDMHYTIVTNSDAEILLCNIPGYDYGSSTDLFDIIDESLISDGLSSVDIMRSLLQRKSGRFNYECQGHKNYVLFSYVGINDWYTFQITPDSNLLEAQTSFNKISVSMLINYILLLCIIFMFFFYFWYSKNKEIKERINQERMEHFNLLSHLSGGVAIIEYSDNSNSGNIVYMNAVFSKMTGYSLDDIKSKFGGDIINLIHPDDNPEKLREQCKSLKTGDSYQYQYRLLKSDGTYLWIMDSGYVYSKNGKKFNQILFSDISTLKEHENLLRLNTESMKIATSLISGCVFEYDFFQKKYIILENIDKILGKKNKYALENCKDYTENPDSFFEMSLRFFHPKDYKTAFKAYVNLNKHGSAAFQARINKDGEYIWYKFHLILVYNDLNKAERIIGNIIDINDTQSQMEHLQNIAEHDPLTKIYNRQAFVMNVKRMLVSMQLKKHAFFLLDVDNFKGINDNYGHGFGDFVLKNLANNLCRIFSADTDVVARLGGDEFVVFTADIGNMDNVYSKAEQICSLYKTKVTDGNTSCNVSYSVGISIYMPYEKKDVSLLYRQADTALYKSKENGKNRYTIYNENDAKAQG